MDNTARIITAARPAPRSRLADWFAPAHMIMLARQRRQLAELDDDQLRDIGLTRAEAEAEAARPFWDVPLFWMARR